MITLKRISIGHYWHVPSGIEIKRTYQNGQWIDEWVVTEKASDTRSWVSTVDTLTKARSAVEAHVAKR